MNDENKLWFMLKLTSTVQISASLGMELGCSVEGVGGSTGIPVGTVLGSEVIGSVGGGVAGVGSGVGFGVDGVGPGEG